MTLLRLFPQGPTDPETALRMLATHAIPGAEEADIPSRTYTRLLPHAGASVRVTVTFTEDQRPSNEALGLHSIEAAA
ncbi:hypothetical protein ACVWZD_008996 [Streptomyces sp. TE3672]